MMAKGAKEEWVDGWVNDRRDEERMRCARLVDGGG